MLLSPVQARKLVTCCIREKCALLAVNADSPSAIYDCLKAAKGSNAPVIIETSMWQLEGISFGAGDPVRGMAQYIAHIAILANSEEFKDVPVLYHTDHIRGPLTREILLSAVRGLPLTLFGGEIVLHPSTISLDAAKLTPEKNINMLCSLIEASEAAGKPVTLEMEAGLDGGLTTEDETRELVMGVEENHPGYVVLFAPGLGNRHGYSKDGYPGFKPENVSASAALVKELTGRDIGIVLHGSSGLSDHQVQSAVANGLTKMNWSTSGLIIRSGAAKEYYAVNADKIVPGHPEFKDLAMDSGQGSYVSRRFVPELKKLFSLLRSEGKGISFMKEIISTS